MKTNVSIRFNSIEEYREIEKKLIELGYVNDEEWNNDFMMDSLIRKNHDYYYILIYKEVRFEIHNHKGAKDIIKYHYDSLEEFLNDNKK